MGLIKSHWKREFGMYTSIFIINFKFKKTGVADLSKQPEFIQLSGPSSFFKAEAIGDIKFNVKLHFVCKGSFKPDVCNIHSKEQSLFLA